MTLELEHSEMLGGLYPYLEELAGPQTGVLAEMEEYGRRRRFPIVGPLVGKFLMQLAMLRSARHVLEIGSGYGYSAAWFLRAGPAVRVTCTDSSALNRERAMDFLSRLGMSDRVEFNVGDALSLVEAMEGQFDVIFCDIDKAKYPDAFRVGVPKLQRGGVFIADNALWRGFAWAPLREDVPEFRKRMLPGVREFNRLANGCSDVVTTVIPLRDGLSLSVKL